MFKRNQQTRQKPTKKKIRKILGRGVFANLDVYHPKSSFEVGLV